MKDSLEKNILAQISILNRIRLLAAQLPEHGPAPYYVSAVLQGEIVYEARGPGDDRIALIGAAFGPDGWKRCKGIGGRINYVKTTELGIVVTIDGAESVEHADGTAVDPCIFESSVKVQTVA